MVGKNYGLRLYGELLNAGCAVSFRSIAHGQAVFFCMGSEPAIEAGGKLGLVPNQAHHRGLCG